MAKRWRRLTEKEIACAHQVFGEAIDYSRVKIYRGIPLLPRLKVAVAPNGHIYFPRDLCPPDFTEVEPHFQVWLIHELTHVWQSQHGFRPWFGGLLLALRGGYYRKRCYHYPAVAEGHLPDFGALNMEQQAEVVAHYFAGQCLRWQHYYCHLNHYEACLKDFLEQPKDKSLLPTYWQKRKADEIEC